MKKILVCSIILNVLLVGAGLLLYTLTTIVISVKAEMPDMVCQEIDKLYVNPSNMETAQYVGDTLFRFKDNKLYLSSSDREEYLYNKMTQQEYGRFLSGYKTIIFGLSGEHKNGLVVHPDEHEVSVSRINCTSTK
jgi:hypothetical protein